MTDRPPQHDRSHHAPLTREAPKCGEDAPQDTTQFVHALKTLVGRERYELWFKAFVRFKVDSDELVVVCADEFKLECVRSQFRDELKTAFHETYGTAPAIKFEVDSQTNPPVSVLPFDRGQSTDSAKQTDASDRSDSDRSAGSHPAGNQSSSPTTKHTGAAGYGRRRYAQMDEFIVGDGNRVAHAAVKMVLQRPGAASPLFLYGASGVGKTHLLEGLWSTGRRLPQIRRAVLLSAEHFTTSFLEGLKGGGLPAFRRKYRDVDLLVIDDVQFFLGKRATIVELLHTTDKLLREGRQLAFAADRSPSELTALGGELVARFSAGLVCAVEPLDESTRRGILTQLAKKYHSQFGAETPGEVLDFIACQLSGDGRLLSGALNRLYAVYMATGKPFSVKVAQKTLGDLIVSTRKAVHIEDIQKAVCEVCGVDSQSLQSERRAKAVSHPRMLAMWLARKYTRSAFVEIGEYFGRRSHATVISAQNKVNDWVRDGAVIRLPQGDCNVADVLRQIETQLRTGT